MTINAWGRALQHVLIQGFTLYTTPAVVCMRLAGAARILDDPDHAWAMTCDSGSLGWSSMLPDDDPLKARIGEAALTAAQPKDPQVLFHTQGGFLLVPLEVTEVRDARLRIEAALAVGQAPPIGSLKAIPDELLEREVRRRERERAAQAVEDGSEGDTEAQGDGQG